VAETTTVRISSQAQRTLQQLSKATGRSQTALLDEAVEELRRKRFFEEANRAYAALKADPKAWAEELEERKAWEATLGDGQDD
jgi:predicted transcriptional regulator